MSGGGGGSSSRRKSVERIRSGGTKASGQRGPGGREAPDPCDIALEADLASVKKDVLSRVTVGDSLEVAIVAAGAYQSVVCRVPGIGEILGSLAAVPKLTDLISCIAQGHKYSAIVRKIERGRCLVAIGRL